MLLDLLGSLFNDKAINDDKQGSQFENFNLGVKLRPDTPSATTVFHTSHGAELTSETGRPRSAKVKQCGIREKAPTSNFQAPQHFLAQDCKTC